MAYSDFTFAKLKKMYNIEQSETYLFRNLAIVHINPSPRLAEDLQDTEIMPLYTEKSKSEIIIYPIIRELKKKTPLLLSFLVILSI